MMSTAHGFLMRICSEKHKEVESLPQDIIEPVVTLAGRPV